ncbi:MAG: hypothetical protein GYB68_07500, partial [Chloroflexi bacterium]|nr:hypothetical protein [Chloroflexota bacterium]
HPQVEVVCQVKPRQQALQLLIEGDVHIALTSLREPHKDIEYRPFLTDSIILVVPAGHRWAQPGMIITPEDLLEEPLILREDGCGTQEALRDALAAQGINVRELNIAMVLGNAEAIRMSVQEGIGLAFVSAMVALEGIQSGLLVPVQVEGVNPQQTLYLARHTGRPATTSQTAFWEYAFAFENEHIRNMPDNMLASAVASFYAIAT